MTRNSRWIASSLFVMALALIAWAYWPGLDGPFLFDDYANLNALGAYGQLNNLPSLLYYLTSGIADPTGRPVALLSFLLDGNTWPTAPWPFKRTNLCLHLLNTALLAGVMARLQVSLQRRHPQLPVSKWAPVLAATLWGAHPFFVSTTLYVVQREAMLPMTFVLLALLAWDRAVQRFSANRQLAGWGWAVAGFGGATLLAGLSKANGFLAPLLVGLAYLFFLRPVGPARERESPQPGPVAEKTRSFFPRSNASWRPVDVAAGICLGVPSLLLVTYLVHTGVTLWPMPQLPTRDWTVPERLLSESRALWTYVGHLLMPRAGGGGLYVEDFAASRGWFQPMTTLPALLALLASVVSAIALRRRFQMASFAWLFFLAGHLLESTTLPLELYFEHRNYLPAMFLGWPLAHWLCRAGPHDRWRLSLAGVAIAGLLLLTHQRASVWSDEALLNALSADHETDSRRAQVLAAADQVERGDVAAGLARMHALQQQHPASVDIAINAIALECQSRGTVSDATLAYATQALRSARTWNYGLYEWMQGAATDRRLRACQGFGLSGLQDLVAAAEANPQSAPPSRKRDLWHVRGRIALAQGKPEVALHWFDAVLALQPDAEYALVQAAALGEANAQALGARHLDHYTRIAATIPSERMRNMGSVHAWLLRHGYYPKEVSLLRQRLQADRHLIRHPASSSNE